MQTIFSFQFLILYKPFLFTWLRGMVCNLMAVHMALDAVRQLNLHRMVQRPILVMNCFKHRRFAHRLVRCIKIAILEWTSVKRPRIKNTTIRESSQTIPRTFKRGESVRAEITPHGWESCDLQISYRATALFLQMVHSYVFFITGPDSNHLTRMIKLMDKLTNLDPGYSMPQRIVNGDQKVAQDKTEFCEGVFLFKNKVTFSEVDYHTSILPHKTVDCSHIVHKFYEQSLKSYLPMINIEALLAKLHS